ncbi:hypothetical protein [Kingella negevensis]|uniref:hypothetical protein n=1 Tax=Kingella negevensis TaxID=1522312 RepID=UPI00050A02D2|nr:hypothetical protein [Kingella negevensis]MDK4688300.1 hypothetical protein [Kingella negevensis]
MRFTQTEPNTIVAQYDLNLTTVNLTLKLVGNTQNTLTFQYVFPFGLGFVANIALGSPKMKKLTVDTSNKTIRLNLAEFALFRPMLKQHTIQAAKIENNEVILQLAEI